VEISPADAARLGLQAGQMVEIRWDGRSQKLPAITVAGVPAGAVLLPRSTGVPLTEPVRVEIRPAG
jgi:anaerobic selenocysteine-containing dehydrogenase